MKREKEKEERKRKTEEKGQREERADRTRKRWLKAIKVERGAKGGRERE